VVPGVAAAQESGPKVPKVSQECIEKLEEGGTPDDCQKAPSPILPAGNELVWGVISFTVLVILLGKFAYPPIKQMMEDRTQRIRDNLDEAEKTKNDAQSILDDYQRQLADAKNESSRIIEEARQTAEQMRKDLMARAEAEAVELRQRNQTEINAARDRLLADIQTQVRGLAIDLAEKVVEKNLDRDTQLALIESYINQVGSGR
jgi:F-type H+-transporting ATPase subunit b